jgi:hypothetical protein
VEGDDEGTPLTRPDAGFLRRLAGATIGGAFLASLAMVAAGWLLKALAALLNGPDPAAAYSAYLATGAWLWFPLWGAALGALLAARWAPGLASRGIALAFALAVGLLPLVLRPVLPGEGPEASPRTPQAKMHAVLRWSYRTPATVLKIVAISRDPDPRVREQAVLALGVNLIVTDIEHATPGRPALHADSPVRDSLRVRLLECLGDPVEIVRAEASRALWKAPRCFGAQPAAAETLAALLGRAMLPGAPERLAWLALDAAAGAPDTALQAAAARFAVTATDSDLRAAARRAALPRVAPAAGTGYKSHS